jgi:flagellar biosynthesis/type III secretory pathway M-ring protein FliF/YscJ
MWGYIILAVFVVFVFACFFSFLGGLKMGKKQAAAEYAEDQRRKAQDEKDYRQAAEEIKQGAFKNAETKKADLSSGTTGRDRFDAINDSLRNNP